MDMKQASDTSAASFFDESSGDFMSSDPFNQIDSNHPRKWGVGTSLEFETSNSQPFFDFHHPTDPTPSSHPFDLKQQIKQTDQLYAAQTNGSIQSWDPKLMLGKLSILEQKIHHLRDVIHSIVNRQGQVLGPSDDLIAHQHLAAADFTAIIIQLISTAGSLLPSARNTFSGIDTSVDQLASLLGASTAAAVGVSSHSNQCMLTEKSNVFYLDENKATVGVQSCVNGSAPLGPSDELDVKDCEDLMEGEQLPPGSYEVLQLEKEEILAPHTHFCAICGKGFKRDANLRMHMRGHGDEYKTPSALSKPLKESLEPILIKRYSCPSVGCKRNKDHKKFQPLKTILCVKNHYKRSHCDKSYTCSRCGSKKFSVLADLKTHEKHCGRVKWLCSCGTTFSRKDKLFGHVALFQGHSPVLQMDETEGLRALEQGQISEGSGSSNKNASYGFGSNTAGEVQVINFKGVGESEYFSAINFNTANFGEFHECPQP